MSVRATLKACFEAGLVRSGVPALHRAARAGQALVLAYHNVVPDSCPPFGDRSLHLPRRLFVRQLECLLTTHTIVPLDELLRPPLTGRRGHVAAIRTSFPRGDPTAPLRERRLNDGARTPSTCPSPKLMRALHWSPGPTDGSVTEYVAKIASLIGTPTTASMVGPGEGVMPSALSTRRSRDSRGLGKARDLSPRHEA